MEKSSKDERVETGIPVGRASATTYRAMKEDTKPRQE
jgi:hypothetical protein